MSETKKIATRFSYGNALVELGREHEDVIVLDADLAASTKSDLFREVFPGRFIECGIAEANMIGVAGGLSLMGLVPFASTFAMFSAGRAFEQIRNTVGYPHLNVKIAGSHAGLSAGEDGASHQSFEDIALMRTIPGMTVLVPCDDTEARQAVFEAYRHDGPVYIRLSKAATEVIHDETYRLAVGRGEVLREGNDIAVIACGMMVQEALAAASRLREEGIRVRVINLATIKPLDEDLIVTAAKECGRIVTCEEHSVIGGLGEAVAGVLGEKCPVPLRRVGINDAFGHSGRTDELWKEYGLSAEHVAEVVREMMKK